MLLSANFLQYILKKDLNRLNSVKTIRSSRYKSIIPNKYYKIVFILLYVEVFI